MAGNHSVFILLLVVATVYGQTDDERRAEMFRRLANAMTDIRDRTQYAVLYLPPPNRPFDLELDGQAMPEQVHDMRDVVPRPVIYPVFPNDIAPANVNFDHNWAAINVDRRGRTYRNSLGVTRARDLHTEQLALDLVFPRMLAHYRTTHDAYPPAVYLYTFFIPCPNCQIIIQNNINDGRLNTDGGDTMPLYVGFSDFGGTRGRDTHDTFVARQNEINDMLTNGNGALLHINNILHGCQPPPGRKKRDLAGEQQNSTEVVVRRKRSALTCDLREELDINMDFSTGKATAHWYDPHMGSDSRSWVELLDANGNRMDWQWAYSHTEYTVTFGSYISNGMYVKVIRKKGIFSSENPGLKSKPWNNCDMGWRKMNNLPASYGDVRLAISVSDGYPVVGVAFCNGQVQSDKIVLQQFDSEAVELLSVDISSMKSPASGLSHIKMYTSTSRLTSSFASGFRAKYVQKGWITNEYGGLDDNASPFWTPYDCEGVDRHDPQANVPITDTNDPCGAVGIQCQVILVISLLVLCAELLQ